MKKLNLYIFAEQIFDVSLHLSKLYLHSLIALNNHTTYSRIPHSSQLTLYVQLSPYDAAAASLWPLLPAITASLQPQPTCSVFIRCAAPQPDTLTYQPQQPPHN